MKILVRMPNWLGDAILALPALRTIASNFPQAELWVAASSRTSDLLAAEASVAGVLEVAEVMGLREFWRTGRRWRQMQFDLAILFTNSFGSALLMAVAGIPSRWGYKADGRTLLLTRAVPQKPEKGKKARKEKKEEKQEEREGKKEETKEEVELYESNLENDFLLEEKVEHQLLYYLRLLRGFGLEVSAEPEITITVTQEERESACRQLQGFGLDLHQLKQAATPLVILNPGAAYGSSKRWPATRFGYLAESLEKRRGAVSVIIGSVDEVALAHEVVAASLERGINRPPVVLSGQTTLRELMGLLSWADLMVTNDTGPMHLANAMRVPVVALFGPTEARRTRPWHQPSIVLHKRVICWPCWYRECPYDHRCLEKISEAEVLSSCLSLLEGQKKEAFEAK